MSAIVPRWEWRGFGADLRAVGSAFCPAAPDVVQESDELYVLSARGTDAVKVRDELMDVKHLVEVDADGLEQWVPVMKTGFPLSVDEVASVLLALGVEAPSPLSLPDYTLRAFLDEMVGPSPDLLAVEVHKRRERFTLSGCMAELTEVGTSHATTHTIAIESEDASRVIATVREVGLASRPNVSFVRGLKALVRFGTERFAVVDVGHELGEVPHRRAASGRWLAKDRRPGHADSTRRRAAGDRAAQPGADAADGRGHRRHGRGGQEASRCRHRGRGHGRPADGAEQRGVPRGRADPVRSAPGDHLRGAGGAPRLPRGDGGHRAGRGVARGLRHGWRQLAVHLRVRRPGRGAVQRQRGCRPLHRALRPRPRRHRGDAGRGPRGSRPGPRPSRRPTHARRARRDGRGGHEPRRGQARTGSSTTRTSSRGPSSTGRRSTGRSRSTAGSTSKGVVRSSASSHSAPTSSSRGPASCGPCSASSGRTRSPSATGDCVTVSWRTGSPRRRPRADRAPLHAMPRSGRSRYRLRPGPAW